MRAPDVRSDDSEIFREARRASNILPDVGAVDQDRVFVQAPALVF